MWYRWVEDPQTASLLLQAQSTGRTNISSLAGSSVNKAQRAGKPAQALQAGLEKVDVAQNESATVGSSW
jgi:hypothetical protein